jgi:hypothetical protein
MAVDSFPSQSGIAASMWHESGGTSQPDFFLKTVAGGLPRHYTGAVWSKLGPLEMAIPTNRERPLSISH